MVLHSPTHCLICFFIAAFVKATAPFDGLSFILEVDGVMNDYFCFLFRHCKKKGKEIKKPTSKKVTPTNVFVFCF
jgi:hypothetical protein